ncbi:MAG TPA: cupin domain-containing protein [Gemmataceae bacterium]|nr:cupin domain-containing protein [Gemmataceae bacterium]
MKMKVLFPGDSETLNVLGNQVFSKLVAADTGGVHEIIETSSPPRSGVPPHVHSHEDETAYVLEGDFEFRVGEQRIRASGGTFLCLPRGAPHGFTNMGTTVGRVLFTISPAHLCPMFEELSRLPAGPPDLAQVQAICQRYGIRFL